MSVYRKRKIALRLMWSGFLYCPYCKTPLMNEKDASNSDFGDNIGE